MKYLVKFQAEDQVQPTFAIVENGEKMIDFSGKNTLKSFVASGDLDLNTISREPTPAEIVELIRSLYRDTFDHNISATSFAEVFET
jgi:hypothetical protein